MSILNAKTYEQQIDESKFNASLAGTASAIPASRIASAKQVASSVLASLVDYPQSEGKQLLTLLWSHIANDPTPRLVLPQLSNRGITALQNWADRLHLLVNTPSQFDSFDSTTQDTLLVLLNTVQRALDRPLRDDTKQDVVFAGGVDPRTSGERHKQTICDEILKYLAGTVESDWKQISIAIWNTMKDVTGPLNLPLLNEQGLAILRAWNERIVAALNADTGAISADDRYVLVDLSYVLRRFINRPTSAPAEDPIQSLINIFRKP